MGAWDNAGTGHGQDALRRAGAHPSRAVPDSRGVQNLREAHGLRSDHESRDAHSPASVIGGFI